jgi:HAD superfamily phosphoserine phosphatase-like hydrolase
MLGAHASREPRAVWSRVTGVLERPVPTPGRALVVFDLDGTLLRGPTVCEVLARSLGRLDRMQQLERFVTQDDLRAAREEMAGWYRAVGIAHLRDVLRDARVAPGAREGLALLGRHGVVVGIASITWGFAVEHFARRLGADHWLGTVLEASGVIRHVWPEDKASWVRGLAARLEIPPERTAAVGDSAGDAAMLQVVGLPIFVGREPPPQPGWLHRPQGDIAAIARDVLRAWSSCRIAPPR